jgi:hypothetical protein
MHWFSDVFVGYLVRLVTRLFKGRGSEQWPRESATVWSSKTSDLFPGGLAEIIYSYSHQGEYFSGTHEKQFLSYFEATQYIAGFPKGTEIVVRIKPGYPKMSVVRDDDQTEPKSKSRVD